VEIYQVGGAVRDRLLGLPVSDRDWVVVGATPQALIALGYRPVGKDFPVFLHPQTKEEYALARTERKTGRGYKGFVVFTAREVTLEQDLARRDLTINAIACAEDGTLIDPFGGARDLRHGVLRHVSPAFAEDPVRILRVARFAARFAFEIAPETLTLMREMVASGEVDHLVPERAWQELSRGCGSVSGLGGKRLTPAGEPAEHEAPPVARPSEQVLADQHVCEALAGDFIAAPQPRRLVHRERQAGHLPVLPEDSPHEAGIGRAGGLLPP